jgi:hypothetical protein
VRLKSELSIAGSCAALAFAAAAAFSIHPSDAFAQRFAPSAYRSTLMISLSGESTDEDKELSSSEVDKYVATYKAMQKDRALTVEQAAAKNGMTISQFRSLEDRVERDDAVRERVRKALRPKADSAT